MKITVNVWRQPAATAKGRIVKYQVEHVSPDMSFLEMLDVLNQQLIAKGEEPVAFDHDCREGICGSCGVMINGLAHGGNQATTTDRNEHCVDVATGLARDLHTDRPLPRDHIRVVERMNENQVSIAS